MNEEVKSPQEGAGLIAKEVVNAMREFLRSEEFRRLVKEVMTQEQTIAMTITPLPRRNVIGSETNHIEAFNQ